MTQAQQGSAPGALKALDVQVRARLAHLNDHAGVQLFDRCWRSIEALGDQSPDKARLANLYASTMRASQVDFGNDQDVRRCVAIGRRALRLAPTCLAAEEQLAIVYSALCVPVVDIQRWVDRTVDHANIWQLRPHSAEPLLEAKQGHAQVSADFYFAYWRTYHQHPSRSRQAAWALAAYQRAPADQRHCDEVLRGLQILGLRVAVENAR